MNQIFFLVFLKYTIPPFLFASYTILPLDVPLLKSDFFLRSEFLIGLSVGIFRIAEGLNLRRYTFKQELMYFLTKSRVSSISAQLYRMIRLD